jgi:hypothetical protein
MIRSQVQRDLDPRVTALARTSDTCTSKLQTRHFIRERAPFVALSPQAKYTD